MSLPQRVWTGFATLLNKFADNVILRCLFSFLTFPFCNFQQQHDQFIGPPYDPSRDLSPNLPSCDSSMGDAAQATATTTTSGDLSISGGSSCSTPSSSSHHNNNNNHHQSSCCASSKSCRHPHGVPMGHDACRTSAELCGGPHPSFEHHIPKLEPLQPPGTPPSPSPIGTISDETGNICAGCGMKISDRYYLQAVDRRWHAACLQCCQCRNTLDGEITCFSRDGNIYCKKDYYR